MGRSKASQTVTELVAELEPFLAVETVGLVWVICAGWAVEPWKV
jgi:hypothetical protein